MELLAREEVPFGPDVLEVRESPIRRFVSLVIIAGVVYAASQAQEIAAHYGEDFPQIIEWVFVGITGLMFLFSFHCAWRVSSERARVLWSDGERLAIDLRSWITSGLDASDPTVAVFSLDEFRSARLARDKITISSSESQSDFGRILIELEPNDPAVAEKIQQEIRIENARKGSGWTVRQPSHRVMAVSDEGRLQIVFRGPGSALRPSARRVLDFLSNHTRLEEDADHRQKTRVAEDGPTSDDAGRLLREALERGSKIEAIRLARQLHGFGLRDAKIWVEKELDDRASSTERSSTP